MPKQSLTQKYFPTDAWNLLSRRTSFGTTAYDCIKSALENPNSNVGLYAPDPEVYDVFADIFHPVIGEYHKVDVATLKSIHDLGDANNLRDLPQNYQDAIVSTRVRVGRTVKGYPMAGKLTKEKRIELEHKIRDSLVGLEGDLAGTYRSLVDMSKEEKDALIDEHILFNDGEDDCLRSVGGYNDWPTGRGIYMNNAKNFIVWVNEEDHIRIISMQKGASLKQVWGRLVTAIHAMEKRLEFVCHPKFGNLTFCPTNIGTGLRASVHVRVPNTAASGRLETICASMDLQPRGTGGEHTQSVGGVYDISNKIRIGRTEWDLINTMWVGVEKLLDNEFNPQPAEKPKKQSLTQKYLPVNIWNSLSKTTSFGTTMIDCVRSALENPTSNVGLYAPDPEVYDVFAEIFHPVIGEYHKVDVATLKSIHDLGDANNLRDLPQNYQDAIVSTRVRVGRTVKGYPMAGKLTKEKRIELEHKIRDSLVGLEGDLAGTYRSLVDMSKEEKDALIDEHILFNDGEDNCLRSVGGYNDWPTGRGIYMNNAKNFIVWVNEEDHIRIISMQKGASLKQVWGRLVTAIHAMEKRVEFVCHPKFGNLTFCPTNIGTGLRASVHVRVPNTAASGKLETICAGMDLQPRGTGGEHTQSVGGVYDISNKIRIGRTEWDLINTMWVGVEKLLDNELSAPAQA